MVLPSFVPWGGPARWVAMTFVALALGGCLSPMTPPATPDANPLQPEGEAMRFGLDVKSLHVQRAAGLVPDFGTLWIGAWNLDKGWLVPDAELTALRASGITPAIHFYYWGDDMAPSCFAAPGCNGKTLEGWDLLGQQLAEHLHAQLQGAAALVILETEFNKGSVARHEPLDALLAGKASDLKTAYPAAQVILGFGGWNPQAWETWDEAAAASDGLGLQAMAGAEGTNPASSSLYNRTLEGARHLQALFGKPLILQDIAVASGPPPANPALQVDSLQPFLDGLQDFKDAGVETILYRSFLDNPAAPRTNYYGEAERHFGLAAGTGALKPAGEAWLAAIQDERRLYTAGPATAARPQLEANGLPAERLP